MSAGDLAFEPAFRDDVDVRGIFRAAIIGLVLKFCRKFEEGKDVS